MAKSREQSPLARFRELRHRWHLKGYWRGGIIKALERLTISEALRIAEQQTGEAQKDKDAGDLEGEERRQQWCDTLHVLEVMKERGVPDSMKDD